MNFEDSDLYLMDEDEFFEFTERFEEVEPEYLTKNFNEIVIKKEIEYEEREGCYIIMVETQTPYMTEEGLDFDVDDVEYYFEDEAGDWIPLELDIEEEFYK